MAKKVYDEKISKSTDWGGDESTSNLPVAGSRVQEFIKEQLNSKAGVFHYDTTNNRYIVFSDVENRDAYLADPSQTSLIIGTFDAPFNYSAEITLSSPVYVAILAETKNNYIDFTFDTKNKNGQSVGEAVIVTYTFIKGGIKKTVTEKYQYGASVHFKIDDYISTGSNTITVGIVGQNTLAATTIGITYLVVDLQLSDTYDISQSYDLVSSPAATAAIPYQISGYGTKIMEWYLDGTLLDYIKVEDEIVDVSTTRTKYISLANLSQGIHTLQYRAYTVLDGDKFYSNILYRDLIVVTGADKNPIIAVKATIPVGNDIISSGKLQLYGITQYIPYELNFAVYNPTSVISTDAAIAIDGKVDVIIQTHDKDQENYSLRSTEYGVKFLTITAGETVYTIGLNISKSATSLEPIINGLQLDLMSLGKSNNDVNREEWTYGLYSASFNGFNWNKTSGWVNNRLLINAGASIDINIAPLSPDPTTTGKTLEFEFATANVSDENAVICDLRNNSGTGILITASEVTLMSAGGAKVNTKFKSEENIRIALVIHPKSGTVNRGLVFIYINGILSGSVNYSTTDNFTSDKVIRIGNTKKADVRLKALRFYNAALNSDQILNNYILYRDTTEEMLTIYDRNAIYEEGSLNFSVDKLSAQCPVFIFTGDIPALENTTDKNKTIYVDVEYINMQTPYRSFTAKGIRLRPQGTSSMGYPKKNFRPYTGYGTMWDNLSNVIVDGLYSFAERAQPVNVWCLKADYAESSGTHNTGIARLWNQVIYDAQLNGEYILRTEAQKAAIAAGYPYDVRTAVYGFPCHVLYRLTADSELIYIGKYNYNNDKSTESVYGFRDIPGFNNSKMQCWEILNNGNHLALFQDMDNFDSEWDQAYESRYPDKSENVADLKTFSEWVVSTKGDIEKFKTEKWQHLDVYKVAAYYIYLMRFGAVDQVVKNGMLTSEDGEHFYFINYDNDTIIGVRNDGLLAYDYDIDRQTIDTSFSALVYAYAGHDSTLWNNLEADSEFIQIVSQVDNALYMAGLSYEKTIDMFDNQQAGKWCERVYNQDAQYKYIDPYTNNGINNLFMLQGNRSSHRRWWLSHRFNLLDSKFVSGAYKAKSIEFKAANAPAGIHFGISVGNKAFYGYGLNNVVVESGIELEPGETYGFTTKQVINVGDPVRIYSAPSIQELDVSNFIPYLSTLNISEVYDETVGTKLKKLVLGVDTATDDRRNTSMYAISGLAQAIRLEYLDISGYQGITNIDLSTHTYLTTLKAYESGLTGIVLANGSPVTTLELPDTMQSIQLDSLPNLGSGFSIKNYGRNLSSIIIRNCGKFDSSTFVMNWYTNKVVDDNICSLTLEGINWLNVDADTLIVLGGIKKSGGTLSMKGMIVLTEVTLEQITKIKSIFGNNCTNPDNELYIKAPDGIYLTGPSEILKGDSAQYNASVFSEHLGKVRYCLLNGTTETLSYNNATIDAETGFLTTIEDNFNVSLRIVVRAKHIPTQGAIVIVDMNVDASSRYYPNDSAVSIVGNNQLTNKGSFEYQLRIDSYMEITGRYSVEWSLSGEAFDKGLVSLGVQNKDKCIVNVLSPATDITPFSITAKMIKAISTAAFITKSMAVELFIPGIIMTKNSNPEVMAICYAQGWTDSEDYMTEREASAVSDISTYFEKVNMKTFTELKYFINISQISYGAFRDCSKLESITLPESTTSIGGDAFRSCSSLKSITIPKNVISIGRYAFFACYSFTSISLPQNLTTVSESLFYNCNNLTSIYIPEGVTEILMNAFYNCSKLESITIPKNICSISTDAFLFCTSLKAVTVDIDNSYYSDIDGVLFNKDHTSIIICPNNKDSEYTIPDQVISIGDYAFYGCSKLESITLPESITSIGGYAFRSCSSLKSITVPEGITKIERNTFSFCAKLVSCIIPDGVININNEAFSSCVSLESIVIPKSVKSIGNSAFLHCDSLTSITILNGLTDIGPSAFASCISLVYIELPESVSSIGESAFIYCSELTSLTLPKQITAINSSLFQGCSSLESISIPENVTSIESSAFLNCDMLTSITIPAKTTKIANSAFSGCVSLASIAINNQIAPNIDISSFGSSYANYAGYKSHSKGTNMLYVPVGATGYDTGCWLDPLQNPEKCGFTISYTL